ncbi:F-box/FBD/LRR-repeat protein At1g13570-like [Bidens hawaiensis]|uniref:F-box/FBD/LRR-repeat protein At1g13570-like n=1 Tax=Bidens hawaiensis TaxID=980011 RepID=UPI00404A94C8
MEAECSSKAQRSSLNTINALPQTIIESILCLLPIEEAARTSILSSEWRYKWTKIPKLVFHYSIRYKSTTEPQETFDMASARKKMDNRCKLFYAIQQVLLLCQGPIHEFTLSTDADYQSYEIDQIILHLSRNHTIKKLTLDLYYGTSYIYKLPLCVFSLHHLTDLLLCSCDLNHKPTFSGYM